MKRLLALLCPLGLLGGCANFYYEETAKGSYYVHLEGLPPIVNKDDNKHLDNKDVFIFIKKGKIALVKKF